MRIELRDPFGTCIGEGHLTVHDSPGADAGTPSTTMEIRDRFLGRRLPVQVPDVPDHMAYTVLVIE